MLMAGLLALLAHHPAASDGSTWPAGSWTAALQRSPAEGNDYGMRLHNYLVTEGGPPPNVRSHDWGV